LVLGLAVAVFAGVYVFEGGSPVGYVVVDGVRVYLVNSSVSLFVDYGGNVTVVYCGGVLWGVGPGVWFNVSLSSISIFEVYVDGVLVDRFAVKPARTSHNPFVTDLTLSLSKSRVVRGEVVSAWLSWVRHSWCPADFVKVLARGRDGSVYELGRFRWPYWELVRYGAESKSVSFVVDLPPGVYEVRAVACSCHGTASFFDPGWGDVCYDGGFKGRSPEELSWTLYEAASPVVNLTVLPTELDLLRWAAVHGLDAGETNRLLSSFGLEPYVDEVQRRNAPFVRFVLKNGSTVEVPVLVEVQGDGEGVFVVGNPSFVSVSYIAKVRVRGAGGVRQLSLSLGAGDGVLLYPVLWSPDGRERIVSMSIYVPAGTYSLGNFSVAFREERLVAENRSLLLRPIYAFFVPEEVKKRAGAVPWCDREFWEGFESVADTYVGYFAADVALTIIPWGKVAGIFGKLGVGGKFDKLWDLANAVRSSLSGLRWVRAAYQAGALVVPSAALLGDLAELVDGDAVNKVVEAYGIDIAAVEQFHAGVLSTATCRHAGMWYGATFAAYLHKVSLLVEIASTLHGLVSPDVWHRFGASLIELGDKVERFNFRNHAAYLMVRSWGPQLKDWPEVFDELADPLLKYLGLEGKAVAVVSTARNGVYKKGGFYAIAGLDMDKPLIYFNALRFEHNLIYRRHIKIGNLDENIQVLHLPGEGGLYIVFEKEKRLLRFTNQGVYEQLNKYGLATHNVISVETSSVKIGKREYDTICISAIVRYDSEFLTAVKSGVGDWARHWRQRFATLAVPSILGSEKVKKGGGGANFINYAYEVDVDKPQVLPKPVSMAGVFGEFLEQARGEVVGQTPWYLLIPGTRGQGESEPSDVGLAPDLVALGRWGRGDAVFIVEVSYETDKVVNKFRSNVERLEGLRYLKQHGGEYMLTKPGVAYLAFRVDALSGTTVGGMAKARVAGDVIAHPQKDTSLLQWAEFARRPAARAGEEALYSVAPVFVKYEGDGPVYTLRIFAVEKWVQSGGELEEAVRKCLG